MGLTLSEYSARPLFNYESCVFNQQEVNTNLESAANEYSVNFPDTGQSLFVNIYNVCDPSSPDSIFPNITGDNYGSRSDCTTELVSPFIKDAGCGVIERITYIQTNAPDNTLLHGRYADASISYTVEDAEYNLIVKFIIHGTVYPIFLCYSSQENCDSWATGFNLNPQQEDVTNGFLVVGADENTIAMLSVASDFYVLLTKVL